MPAFRLIRVHRGRDNEIIIWGKDDLGYKIPFVVEDFPPYFYVKELESVNSTEIIGTEFGFISIYGDKLRKVIVDKPDSVYMLRDKFLAHWEADIPFARRYIIDRLITSGFDEYLIPCEPPKIDLSVGYLDIEVYSGDQMPDADKDKITCVCLSDSEEYVSLILDDFDIVTNEDNWAVIHLRSEEKLLKLLVELLYDRNYDALTGWNIFWDKEYLEKRCYKYKLQLPLSGTCVFDLLQGYRTLYRRKSYRLKDIAMEEGLTEELEEKVNYGLLWEKDKPSLLVRNKRHTEWVVEIDKKLKIVDYYCELKELAGLEDLDSIYPSILFDTMLLRRTNWVLPSKSRKERESFEGALTLKPASGIMENVAVYDLSRFYPQIIVEECLDNKILYDFQYIYSGSLNWEEYKKFAKKYTEEGKPTLLLGLVKDMIEERKKLQASPEHKEKLAAIKGLLNASYGVSAHPNFRLFTPEIPERVAEVARNIITAISNEVENWGYKVIYLDTDSVFCQVPKEEVSILEDKINEALVKYGDYSVKTEHFFPKILFTGVKKRYVGMEEDGTLCTTGFEKVRSDSSEFTKEIQEEVMRMMLMDEVDNIIPYLKDKISGIRSCSLKEIAITKTLSRNLDGYEKHEQSYILAARQAKLDVKAGDAVNIIPARNYPQGVAVFVDIADLPREIDVDWNKVVDKQIKMKVESLLPIVGLDFRMTLGQQKLL